MVVFNYVYIQQNNLIFEGVLVTFEPRGLKLIFFKGPLTAMWWLYDNSVCSYILPMVSPF